MNYKGFKKVHEDKDSAVLAHPHGHHIKISKRHLNKENLKLLQELNLEKEEGKLKKMAFGGEAERPCLNPSCKSYGSPHPNCNCYAEGGMVGNYCDSKRKHESDCQYFKDGGAALVQGPQKQMPQTGEQVASPSSGAPTIHNHYYMAPNGAPQPMNSPSPQPVASPMPQGAPQEAEAMTHDPSQSAPLPQAGPVPQNAPQPSGPVAGTPPGFDPNQSPETQPQLNPAPALNQMQSGIEGEKLGHGEEAQALGQEGRQQASAQRESANRQRNYSDEFHNNIQYLVNEQKQAVQWMKDNPIQADRYIKNMGTGSKILTVIGMALGGGGAAMAHQNNIASDFINKSIEQDIEAQKANMDRQHNLVSALHGMFGDVTQAADMARVIELQWAKTKVDEAASLAQGPIAKAKAMQINGGIDKESAQKLFMLGQQVTNLQQAQRSGDQDAQDAYRVQYGFPDEGEKSKAMEDLKHLRAMETLRNQVVDLYRNSAEEMTPGNRLRTLDEAKRRINMQMDPLLNAAAKEIFGRNTHAEVEGLKRGLAKTWATAKTKEFGEQQMSHLFDSFLKHPRLLLVGIKPRPIPHKKMKK